jgi:hypothetical protein
MNLFVPGVVVSFKVKNTDIFVAVNAALFIVMCAVVYYDRFLRYRGRGNVHEFFIYAGVILAAIVFAWIYLRRFTFQSAVLVLVQAGILAHFAGAFVPVDGGRLYDAEILSIRYDKYVHCLNAFAAAAVVAHVFDILEVHLPLIRNLVLIMVVLGLGAVVEIVEYVVMQTIPNAGVGAYDNNMQDLIGNMVGGMLFIAAAAICRRLHFPVTSRPEEL